MSPNDIKGTKVVWGKGAICLDFCLATRPACVASFTVPMTGQCGLGSGCSGGNNDNRCVAGGARECALCCNLWLLQSCCNIDCHMQYKVRMMMCDFVLLRERRDNGRMILEMPRQTTGCFSTTWFEERGLHQHILEVRT